MKSGVYKLVNTITGKKYYGSSVNLMKRKGNHFFDLRRGQHSNVNLQADFNEFGEAAFKFEIIASSPKGTISKEMLLKLEQALLDLPEEKYNIAPNAGTNKGRPFRPFSEEHKRKLSKAVIAFKDNGEEHLFESRLDASKALNLNHSNISSVLKGRRKTAGGWKFREA